MRERRRILNHRIERPFDLEPGYLVLSGSRLYGIDGPDSDYDYVGAIVEPDTYRLGLDTYTQGKNRQHGFEQHEFHGSEFEGTVYSLWKFVQMFAEGNPTILCLLFAKPIVDVFGIDHDSFRDLVISKKSGHRFIRYMQSQRKSLWIRARPNLVDAHGYDTKFAAHVVRLGYQGIEFLETGHITLPMPEKDRQVVRSIREGKWLVSDVLELAADLEEGLNVSLDESTLPDEPDHEGLSKWLVRKYQNEWWERLVTESILVGQKKLDEVERNLLTS